MVNVRNAPLFPVYSENFYRNLLILCLTMAAYFITSPSANAIPIDSTMGYAVCTVGNFIVQTNVARGMATVAVIALGIAAVVGRVSWGMALSVISGIAIIYGAAGITSVVLGLNSPAAMCNVAG